MKKIILTGFKPFGDYKFNPTEDLVNLFDKKIIHGYEIMGVVLPCTYFGAFEVLKNILLNEKPDLIISMGLSSSVKGIRIETVFKNLMKSKYPDADLFAPENLKILKTKNAPTFITSDDVNFVSLGNMLSLNKIDIEISASADTFICNSLGYLTCKHLQDNNLPVKNIFLHIPWTDEYKNKIILGEGKIFLKTIDLHKALKLIIKNI